MSARDRYQASKEQLAARDRRRAVVQRLLQHECERDTLGAALVTHAPSAACPLGKAHRALACGDLTAERVQQLLFPAGSGV